MTILLAALLLAGFVGLAGCEPASDPRSSTGLPAGTLNQARPQDQARDPALDQPIVAFGDSLTAGFGVPAEESYPAQLQRRLEAAGYRDRVINAGVSGDTTAGGVRRVDWVLRSRPKLVILELGANDGLRGLAVSRIRANLDEIIRRFRAAGVTVVLAGMKLPPNYGEAYTSQFAAIYPELARRHKLPFMPFFLEGVATLPGLNQGDGIHPTGAGYQIIVDRLVPLLEPYLRKEHTPPAQSAHAGGA
jgi:acyl-CoA thioesterase-1